MKKLLAGAAVLLVGAAGATTYWSQTLAREVFEAEVAELKRVAPFYGLQLEETDLQEGLLSGQARIDLFYQPKDERVPPFFVVLESDLHYGPLVLGEAGPRLGLLGAESRVTLRGLPEATQRKLEAMVGPHLLRADTHVGFSRQLVSDLQVPAVEAAGPQGRFRFAGAQGQVRGDLAKARFDGEWTLGRLDLEAPQMTLHSAAGDGRFEFTRVSEHVAPGTLSFNLPEVNLNRQGSRVTLKDLGLSAEARVESGGLWVSETLSVGELIAPIPVTSASVTFEFEGIDPEAIALWTEMAGSLEAGRPDPQQLRELVTLFLRPGTGFNQRYRVETAEGAFQAHLELDYQGLPDGRHPLDLPDPRQLITALEGNLDAQADAPLVDALPFAPLLGTYLEQGLLLRDGERYRTQAILTRGELTVNGRPVPLGGLVPAAVASSR